MHKIFMIFTSFNPHCSYSVKHREILTSLSWGIFFFPKFTSLPFHTKNIRGCLWREIAELQNINRPNESFKKSSKGGFEFSVLKLVHINLFVCVSANGPCWPVRTIPISTVLPNPSWLTIFSRGRSRQLSGGHRPNSTWPLQLEILINVVHGMPTCNSYTQLYNVRWGGPLLRLKNNN